MKPDIAIKSLIIKILYKVLKKIKGQEFWENIYYTSLERMNYGNGGDFKQSGEINILKHISESFDKNTSLTIFDVGANTGDYSLLLSGFFRERAIIRSFEPSAKTYELFIQATKNIPNIIPSNFGFGDTDSYQLLYSDTNGSGLASVYNRNLKHLGISMDKNEKIKLTTIDNYCITNNIERIHFLKLDIEGHELKALIGAGQMLSNKKIDFIQFEFGGCNIDSKTFFKDFYYFLNDNYHIFRILQNGLVELPEYNEYLEIFITSNFLAIKKNN